jgi:hypothetical protein
MKTVTESEWTRQTRIHDPSHPLTRHCILSTNNTGDNSRPLAQLLPAPL